MRVAFWRLTPFLLALLVSNAQDELPRESLVVVEVPKGSEDSRLIEGWPILRGSRAAPSCGEPAERRRESKLGRLAS